jgi:hypothetical protein
LGHFPSNVTGQLDLAIARFAEIAPQLVDIYIGGGGGITALRQKVLPGEYTDGLMVSSKDRVSSNIVGLGQVFVGLELKLFDHLKFSGDVGYSYYGSFKKWSIDRDINRDGTISSNESFFIVPDYVQYKRVKIGGLTTRGTLSIGF